MNKIRIAKRATIDGVLFLPGVYKKDCKKIEDFFTDRLLCSDVVEQTKYNKLPIQFTTLDNHPKNTNLLCWSCNRSFKGPPWFEPQSISPMGKAFCISIKGNFCGPHCVRRYIQTYTKDLSERLNKISMLQYVYELFTGKKNTDIQPAPPHTDMVQYGGDLTIQEYQKIIEQLNISYMKELESSSFSNLDKEILMKLLE